MLSRRSVLPSATVLLSSGLLLPVARAQSASAVRAGFVQAVAALTVVTPTVATTQTVAAQTVAAQTVAAQTVAAQPVPPQAPPLADTSRAGSVQAAAPQAGASQPGSARDLADISRIESYLNGLKSLKAHFVQLAGDGGLSQGTAWLERPGRMRFQYDPPAPFLLIVGHGVLTFHDRALQQTSNIPLSRTPLGILLADHVVLSGAVTVTAIQRLPGQIQLTLVRTESPGDGSLTLIFADQPLALRQWTVVDAQRRETRVTLNSVQFGGSFDPQLFEQLSPPSATSGG